MATITQLRPGTSVIAPVRYGLLSVVGPTHQRNSQRERLYKCRCACGGSTLATKRALRRGEKKSCGCLRRSRGLPAPPRQRLVTREPVYVVRGVAVPLDELAAVLGRDAPQLEAYLRAAVSAGRSVDAALMPMRR